MPFFALLYHMKIVITILTTFLLAQAGCNKKGVTVAPFVPADTIALPPLPADTTTKTFLALGDSYTIGQSVPDSQRFPVQTALLLRRDSVKCFPPEIIAQTGWTTGNLLQRLNNNPPARSVYDIVTLLIGVNNQYQGRSQQEYRAEFTNLLLRAIQYADNKKKRVTVLSIPDWGVTPFAAGRDRLLIARQIDSFNLINREISFQYGVNYVDITASTRMAAQDGTLLAYDGLHPSGKEYNKWALMLVPVIKQGLR